VLSMLLKSISSQECAGVPSMVVEDNFRSDSEGLEQQVKEFKFH